MCHDMDSQKIDFDGTMLKNKIGGMCTTYSASQKKVHMSKCGSDAKMQHWVFTQPSPEELKQSLFNMQRATCKQVSPEEEQRKYSGGLKSRTHSSVLDSNYSWTAPSNAVGQWLQMDLGGDKVVGGIVSQGRHGSSEHVTAYKVKLSSDGKAWSDHGAVMDGNTDGDTKVISLFASTKARYVRILPEKWSVNISMRAGVLICSALDGTKGTTGTVQSASQGATGATPMTNTPAQSPKPLNSLDDRF